MEIEIIVSCGMVTSKAAAWGGRGPDLLNASQEAIRHAVQNSPQVTQLKDWLESRTKLELSVDFHLEKKRVSHSDLDSMISDLMNPLVEGACGPRPGGKPVPQTKDALFWRVEMSKIEAIEEKVVIRIKPLLPAS